MGFKHQIEKGVKETVQKLYRLDLDPALEHPQDESRGDYATSVALRIASELKSNPLEIATQLKSQISNLKLPIVKAIEVAEPGFLNFWLNPEVLVKELDAVKEEYGSSEFGKGKKVLVEYSSPNIAKPFGIGHLRSTIVGQALVNLYRFSGYEVVGENYLGDWGTQFGKLIVAVKEWGDEKALDASKEPIPALEELYVRFEREAAENPDLEEEGRAWFKKLEEGDREARRLWEKFREWSREEFEKTYRLLGVEIERTIGESGYAPRVPEVIAEARKKGLAQESEGALVIFFPEKEKLPPLMLLKSDGATTYEARDLAAIKARKEDLAPDLVLYEVGAEQTLRFRQLFLAAEMLGYASPDRLVHVAHGLYRFAEGKISTRAGRTVHLEEVLAEAIKRAKELTKGSGEVAEAVGIGAVKYNDLSQHYSSEVVFDWDKILNLQGNSGPYLQYTYARAKSVLRKAKLGDSAVQLSSDSVTKQLNNQTTEQPLLRWFYRFPEVVEDATLSHSPNLVCQYLFELASRFNHFYDQAPILKAEAKVRPLRLALTAATAQILKNGLMLLGIETPEKL